MGFGSHQWRVSFCLSAICLLLMNICVMPAGADDLLHYYRIALQKDPQLRGSQYDHLASRETLTQAYANLLPKVNAEVSYMLNYQDIMSSENRVYALGSTNYEAQTYGVILTQPLFRYSSFLAVGKAKSTLSQADLELEKARQDLILRVSEAYIGVLTEQEKLAAVIAEEAALESIYDRAKERSEKGLATIMERYDAEARLAVTSANRVEAENALKDAKQALSEICELQVAEPRKLKEDIPLIAPFPENVTSWIEAAVKQNPEIRIQRYKADIADREVEIHKAAHYPSLDFQVDYAWKDTGGSLFGGGSTISEYNLLFKLTLPIYEGGLRSSKTREALNLHSSTQEAATRITRNLERRARSSYSKVLSASNRVTAMKKSLEAQKLVLSAKEESFRSGILTGIAVLEATQDLYKYQKDYSQARHDYLLGMLKLKHTAGTLKEEDLVQMNALLQ